MSTSVEKHSHGTWVMHSIMTTAIYLVNKFDLLTTYITWKAKVEVPIEVGNLYLKFKWTLDIH